MKYSFSRVDLFRRCPHHFYYQYIRKYTQLREFKADDPLIIGNALHYGLEVRDIDKMLNYYYQQYPVLTDKVVNEAIKLELAYKKVEPILEGLNILHQEYRIDTDTFVGIIDLITRNDDGTVDIFDFKYSNNVDSYTDSLQLHAYKAYLEDEGFKVNRMGYIFVPKLFIRQKNSENIHQFRKRLVTTYKDKQVQLVEIPQEEMAIVYFTNQMKDIDAALDDLKFDWNVRNPNDECFQCKFKQQYLEIIEKDGYDMALPTNKRREKLLDLSPDFWIYADSYVGKSTFVDTFDDVLFINTDGNTDNTTSPFVAVADIVKRVGRINQTSFGWQTFKDTVVDLTSEENDFKIVAIDLIEDLLEMCRAWVFDKNNIEHESDSGFGKGWDLVKKEFIDTIKRLKALNYQLVFISKENRTEVKTKSGGSYTTFKPNLQERYANILSGVVDLTIHAVKEGDERYIELIADEHTFGGGRFGFKTDSCELNRVAFEKALTDAQSERVERQEPKKSEPVETVEESDEDDKPTARKAKAKTETKTEDKTSQEEVEEVEQVDEETEEKPVRRRRRRA